MTPEDAAQNLQQPAVTNRRVTAGTTITAEVLEDPSIFPDLIDAGLLDVEGALTVGQVLDYSAMIIDLDSLGVIKPETVDTYRGKAPQEYGFRGDTTFNGLNLSELGTVGAPEIQYANFAATTTSPAGYDGAVLSNFKRDQTVIKFDLALTGTEGERINKLNTLVATLQQGQGELVMPGQAELGTHFNAVPNMVLAPNRYIDGFVLPMEFIIPEGCALSDTRTIVSDLKPEQTFEINGILPVDIDLEAVAIWGPIGLYFVTYYQQDGKTITRLPYAGTALGKIEPSEGDSVYIKMNGSSQDVLGSIDNKTWVPLQPMTEYPSGKIAFKYGQLPQGQVTWMIDPRSLDYVMDMRITYQERSVW